MPMIPIIDVLVLAWFIACWVGYVVFARRKSGHTASLVVAMRVYRREWFRHMLGHENRIGDIGALNSLVTGSTFFASTSILILSGLVALLGTPERVIDIVADIPFTRRDSELVWKIKIILLICVLAYAFFKFSWSIRQFNFCAVLIGAAPHTTAVRTRGFHFDHLQRLELRIGRLQSWAARFLLRAGGAGMVSPSGPVRAVLGAGRGHFVPARVSLEYPARADATEFDSPVAAFARERAQGTASGCARGLIGRRHGNARLQAAWNGVLQAGQAGRRVQAELLAPCPRRAPVHAPSRASSRFRQNPGMRGTPGAG